MPRSGVGMQTQTSILKIKPNHPVRGCRITYVAFATTLNQKIILSLTFYRVNYGML